MPPGIQLPQRPSAPGQSNGSLEPGVGSPSGAQDRTGSTVSQLEARNAQIEQRFLQQFRDSASMPRGRRARGA